ncbi:hypothetical protein BC830DRAFT_1223088 [Chytriomyces sp. MP71]|nr:hypothetical protein BC830DRAFT_1223088 [Chytriomyces sp. MP71]
MPPFLPQIPAAKLSSFGESCGGFLAHPKLCAKDLTCIYGPIPDQGGLCAHKSDRTDCSVVKLSFPSIDFGADCVKQKSRIIWNEKTIVGVDFSNMGLKGNLPAFLADLKNLKVLNLMGNHFVGTFPGTYLQFGHLNIFNITGSNVTGYPPNLVSSPATTTSTKPTHTTAKKPISTSAHKKKKYCRNYKKKTLKRKVVSVCVKWE